MSKKSFFENAPDIIPKRIPKGMILSDLLDLMGNTSFEARNLYRGARLWQSMVEQGDTVWLGIAGAGIAGGMGGMVISLMESGFIDVICSTGAQVYHDLHFAFDLPVKAIHGSVDDDALRRHGDVRIYDIGIREKETLEAQDEIIRQFVRESHDDLRGKALSSWEFNYRLGQWVEKNSQYPDRSFVAAAARLGVPVFWDSLANHSITMNLMRTDREGFPLQLSAQKDIQDSAAIVYASEGAGFVLMGGGGPKNFIQQTGPTLHQILGVDFQGAERGIQIGTAVEREGSLSGCPFQEGVTWGKYVSADESKLVHIWAEYSLIFPLLASFVIEACDTQNGKRLISRMPEILSGLEDLL